MRPLAVLLVVLVFLGAAACLAWQVSVAARFLRQGVSGPLVIEGLLSWVFSVLFALGVELALLVVVRIGPRGETTRTVTAPRSRRE